MAQLISTQYVKTIYIYINNKTTKDNLCTIFSLPILVPVELIGLFWNFNIVTQWTKIKKQDLK